MRTCTTCKASKNDDDFSWDNKARTRRHSICKKCHAERNKVWRDGAPELAKAMNRRQVVKRYGLTQELFDEILAKQGGVCAICKEIDPIHPNLSIDHDHSCCAGLYGCIKCIRGLLCNHCNHALGLMKDSPLLIQEMLNYLSKSEPAVSPSAILG